MNNTITIEIRSVYGNDIAYPVCGGAKLFAAIARTKTLTTHNLRCILELGYSIDVQSRFGGIATTFTAGQSLPVLGGGQ